MRYTCMVCCGILTSTTTGPVGDSCGFHQYSPGLSVPVGLPVGVPLVWNDGFSIACEAVSSPTEIARIVRSFIRNAVGGVSTFLFGYNFTCCFSVPHPFGSDARQGCTPTNRQMLRSGPQK